MADRREASDNQPKWWTPGHVLTAALLLAVVLAAAFGASARTWGLLAAFIISSSFALEWQMGRIDSHSGRGRDLLALQRILASAALISVLMNWSIIFAGAFAVLPLAVAHLSISKHRAPWVFFSAACALLALGGPVELPLAWSIPALSLASAGLAVWLLFRRAHALVLPEDVATTSNPTRAALLSQDVQSHASSSTTTERLHDLLTMVRASTRGHFAAVYWLDDAQETLLPAVIETASSAQVYDGPIAVSTAFPQDMQPQIDIASAPLQQHTFHGQRAWHIDAYAEDAQVLIAHIQDEGILLGLLIIERSAARGRFNRADSVASEKCAHLIALQRRDEQAAIAAEKTSHDLQVVALAAEQLSDTLNENEVYRIGEALFQDLLANVDVAFIRKLEDDSLEVAHLSEGWTDLTVGESLPSQDSLVSIAIERRHALPYRSGGESDDPPLFGLVARNDDLNRHLICPLVSGRMAHSAVVLRVPEAGVFHTTARQRLGLLSKQIAAALGIARAYETMAQRATHDGMTQLLNHMAFREQSALAVERAARSERPLSVLILDIDHFKAVNDTYGHAVGDEVIRSVAEVIRSQVRRVDIAARYGGEEFVVLLEDTSADGAYLFAERLRARVEALRHQSEDIVFQVTISLGIAVYPEHAQDDQTLLEQADAALYSSKRNGRNRVTMWQETPQPTSHVA